MSVWQLTDHQLKCGDRVVLSSVATNLAFETDQEGIGCFLRLEAQEGKPRQRLKARLGLIAEMDRFTACRQAPDDFFWMVPAAGDQARQIPPMVQWFLGRLNDGTCLLIVPLFSEDMCFFMSGNRDGSVELSGDTGDVRTVSTGGLAAFVAVGEDPYALMPLAAASVMRRLGTGRLRRQKKVPRFADGFSWCTWDAFYGAVSQEKIREGLASLAAAGVRPAGLIIDDGWQQTAPAPYGGNRLASFDANAKFPGGIKATVEMAKQEFGVASVLVWHAVNGYWGGIDAEALPGYGPAEIIPRGGRHTDVHNVLEWQGFLINALPPRRARKFYADYHAYLAAQGVDGVKVDNQGSLQVLGDNQGGRVRLFAAGRAAMERSTKESFDSALINCMAHATETWYHATGSNVIRTSTDFWPNRPESHGLHLYTNAQVCAWFGEFMLGDWDMFQSGHAAGAFHAAGRAVSGGPVYVSDAPGAHDAALLRKLVCSDGRVLRCLEPGRPTPDCLFHDPAADGLLLKVFNRNRHGWVVGAFNVRWHAEEQQRMPIEGRVAPADVPGIRGSSFVLHAHTTGIVRHITKRDWGLAITLPELGYEVVTLVAVGGGIGVIGLIDRFNASGAIDELTREAGTVRIRLCDGGTFAAWCEKRPAAVRVDGQAVDAAFAEDSGLLTVPLADGPHEVEISRG